MTKRQRDFVSADSGETIPPHSHPHDGACPSRHAPPTFTPEVPTERLAEAARRIADFLSAALASEPIQLFDDLYELKAC